MILLILLDGSPFLIIGNFIEGIIFIMIILPPTMRNVDMKKIIYISLKFQSFQTCFPL